ncbi:LysR family transcriptional regulator [Mucilaginibacter sp. UR6-1]|uniref:LysR family transcriptional regulator n=1 Tax=Mucilaginibacter sp. UR6-1 TaxID=1435643 RepID=UPI001E4094CD|nr:LysR family transcriptional regulator [Mucilaginibacter sp. UR6-1]MCC8407502.1 LysR family transcriptional regulator [Mucilaginibacter sp. UR6-1]
MNLNDLKIFEAVAETGSFTKAAGATFTVQSNVTARIKSLEEEFGAALFARTSRKVSLTPAGHTLMQYSKQIGKLVEEAKFHVQKGDKIAGNLKIGCIETTMALKVPGMLRQFEDLYPEVELEFRSDIRSALISAVLKHELDAAFVPAPLNVSGLDQIKVRTEQLVLISASEGPDIKELIESDPLKIVVFAEGCVFRARLESWLSSKGIINYKSTVLNSIEGIINFVESGIGISLLPEEIIRDFYTGRKIRTDTLNKELSTMNTVMITRKDEPPSRVLAAFMDLYR